MSGASALSATRELWDTTIEGAMIFRSPYPDVVIPETTVTEYVLRGAEEFAGKTALIDAPTGRCLKRLIQAVPVAFRVQQIDPSSPPPKRASLAKAPPARSWRLRRATFLTP